MNTANIHRRRFLQLAGAVAAAVSTLPASQAVAGILTADNRMSSLEQQVFQKILDVSLPTKGSSLVDPATLPVLATLEGALLAGMSPDIRQGLRGGILYFNSATESTYGKPFVELSDTEASRFIDQWAASPEVPHRALAVGLKKLTMLAYWAIPASWKPLGYSGPISDKVGFPVRGNTPEPQV